MPAFFVRTTERKPVRVALLRRKAGGPWWYRYWYKGVPVFRSSGEYSERLARAEAKRQVLAPAGGTSSAAGHEVKALVLAYLDNRWPQYAGLHEIDKRGPKKRLPDGTPWPSRALNRTYDDTRGRSLRFSAWLTGAGHGGRLLSAAPEEVTRWVQQYVDVRQKAVKGRAIHNEVDVIRRFFTSLVKRKVSWAYHPASKTRLEMPVKRASRERPVKAEEIVHAVALARGTPLWPLILLTLGAGLRSRGACAIKMQDLSLGQWPAVKAFEKGLARTVALTPGVVAEFKAWLPDGLPADAFLWPASENLAHNLFQELREKADPPLGEHVTFQALRRVHSTLCYRAGMKPQEESRRLGHSVQVADKHYIQWGDLEGYALELKGNPMENLEALLCKLLAKPVQKPEQGTGGAQA